MDLGVTRTAVRRGGPGRWRGRVLAISVVVGVVGVGCGATQSSPSILPPPSTPTSTIPAPSVVKASPSADPGSAVVAAFVKLVGNGNLSYVATVRGRSRHTTTRLPVKGTISVSGRDYRVTADFTFDTGTGRVDHRYVDGTAWVRFDGGTWHKLTGFNAADSMSPFAKVDGAAAVRYLGPAKVDGKSLYRVQINSVPIHPSLIPAGNLTKETVSSGILELLIDGAGRPVSGTATIEGTGRVSGQLQEIIIELTLTFAKVGQKVTVSAP
jgi:hypothetical protein